MAARWRPDEAAANGDRVTAPWVAANALAAAFLDGPWTTAGELSARGSDAIGLTPRRLLVTAAAVLAAYRDPPGDRRRELVGFIETLPSYERLWKRRDRLPVVRSHPLPASAMGRTRWSVLPIDTVADLADWAHLSVEQLEWFADVKSLERCSDRRLRHYDRTWVYNRRGGVRMLERPRPRLKALQRRVLHEILDLVPVHDAAHGFVHGRSVHTYTAPHVDRDVVVHLDLEAFFATIAAGRVFGVLRTAGYPEPVAHCLTGVATTVVPVADRQAAPQALRDDDVATRRRLLERLAGPHLPQGSPTSPALANLVAYSLDKRLTGLAAALDASYTRYADDLAFSMSGPDAARRARRLIDTVRGVVRDEGFWINEAKTRLTRRSQRQQLCGVVVNQRAGVARRDRDQLRALLHNCRQHGPESQNRGQHTDFRAHLLGRVAWIGAVNQSHGERLRAQFDQIVW
jgi:RNA-directed DNA polymerase